MMLPGSRFPVRKPQMRAQTLQPSNMTLKGDYLAIAFAGPRRALTGGRFLADAR
jgi:hypothetical protein